MPKGLYPYKKDTRADFIFNGGAKIPQLFTRFILYGTNPRNIHIRIYNEGVLSRFTKRLGMRGMEIGDPNLKSFSSLRVTIWQQRNCSLIQKQDIP